MKSKIYIAEVITWIAVTVGIIVLSLATVPAAGAVISGRDKLAHLAAYAVLGFLSYPVVRRIHLPWERSDYLRQLASAGIAFLYCLVIGGVLELLQQYTGRTPELLDFLADAGGSFIGISLAWITIRILQFCFPGDAGDF